MKKLSFVILILFLLAGVFAIKIFKDKINKDLSQPVYAPTSIPSPVPSPITIRTKTTLSLFVPYWTLQDKKIDASGFDKIIYFGIKPDKQGINSTEQEVIQLKKFSDSLPADTPKLLALRMIDSQENFDILSNIAMQQKIIDQTIEVAQKNNMRGIVLDLEITAIPFDSLVKQINKFTTMFYASAKKNSLSFSLTLYGDSFYRARPFEIKTLAQNSDTIMIMAYDLSKAKGNPGPNFPLLGRERFGYDITKMTDDFLQFVPPQKIAVIFGVFGYDWLVDEKGNALEQAQALTYAQIKQKFIDQCEFTKCVVNRDKDAAETKIRYTDKDGKNHIIWFEDMESIKQKQNYLKQKGITSFSFWAYSYF
jgi:spore germination protein YaaH